MDLNEYQQAALRTKAPQSEEPLLDLCIAALGLAGEAGEFADYIKRLVGHKHPEDQSHAAKELGDVLWYLASCADEIGMPLNEIAEMNLEKLRRRYPEGFSTAASIARADGEPLSLDDPEDGDGFSRYEETLQPGYFDDVDEADE